MLLECPEAIWMGAGETGTDTGDIQMGTLLARHRIPALGWLKHRYKTFRKG